MFMNEVLLKELLHTWTKMEETAQIISIVNMNQRLQHFNSNIFYHFFNSFNSLSFNSLSLNSQQPIIQQPLILIIFLVLCPMTLSSPDKDS